MNPSMPARARLRAVLAALAIAFVPVTAAAPLGGAAPLSPQPDASDVTPGLGVTYYYAMFRDVADIASLVPGKSGKPIPVLDHVTKTGKVLTADRPMGVGAEIRGLIHFAEPGTWTFRVNSNDGVRVSVGGVLLHEDPEVHPDTMSAPIELAVPEAGWYALEIDYFQRKGTSALQLLWTPPGGEEAIVPAEALAHRAG